MNARSNERVAVEVSGETVSVSLVLGEVKVTVGLPLPAAASDMTPAQFRNAVLSSARRALDVARQDLE